MLMTLHFLLLSLILFLIVPILKINHFFQFNIPVLISIDSASQVFQQEMLLVLFYIVYAKVFKENIEICVKVCT